jgi:hypothetical protein
MGGGRPYNGLFPEGNSSIEAHDPIMGVCGHAPLNSDETIL